MNFNTTPTRPVQERDRIAIADLLAAASAKLAEASRRMGQTDRIVYWPVAVTTVLGTMEVDDIIEATRDMAEAWLGGTEQEGLPF